MKVVVSACLLGRNCKYNGGNNLDQRVMKFVAGRDVISVCPEECLGVPRVPMEIRDGIVVDRDGNVTDDAIRKTVAKILEQLKAEDIEYAVLKARSPTCGVHRIYDGTFTGAQVPGAGVLAQALMDAGYRVMDEEDLA